DIADAKSDYFGGNSATFLATVNWLTDSSHATLSLPGVASQVEPLMVSAADTGLWSVVLIGVIPLAVIAVGLVVWIRRRKK
ncbi:MAG: hypothetical protein II779_10990, partial [Clostridia bacterium]|nr:hypothetical protein [Clostridia bacterium]